MAIQPISNITAKSSNIPKLNPVTATGYGALVTGTASVIAASNKKIKWHKYLAYAAGAFAFLHTGLILGQRLAFKNQNKS